MERFDFVVVGTPRSRQRRRRNAGDDWKESVRTAARMRWPTSRAPYAAELQIVIIYFYRDETTIDVDNISKLILDAIKGFLFDDDKLIAQLTVRKTDLGKLHRIHNPPEALAPFLGSDANFVYVCLGAPPNHTEIPL
jgi:Holliday junction resolvase RusA-like endonuclease